MCPCILHFLDRNCLSCTKPFLSLSLPPFSHTGVVIKLKECYNKRASDQGSALKTNCINAPGEQAASDWVGGVGDGLYYSKHGPRGKKPKHRSYTLGGAVQQTLSEQKADLLVLFQATVGKLLKKPTLFRFFSFQADFRQKIKFAPALT